MSSEKTVFPYIPNSVPAVQEEMLKEIGASSIDEFFECIPEELRLDRKLDLPDPLLSEAALKRHVETLLHKNTTASEKLSFLGGGCWDHHVPAICDEINSRSEFLTAYAGEPYEDHGRFQALFEYCSMMAELLDVDVVNVPTYDGAQAAATSIRMAFRMNGKKTVLVASSIHPDNLAVIRNYCKPDLKVEMIELDPKSGLLDLNDLDNRLTEDTCCVYFENPSYYGTLETEGKKISQMAHRSGAMMIVGVDPSSLGVIAPPSSYGADIVCGDIQPLGLHMYCGGAKAGFMGVPDDPKFIMEYPSRLFGIAPTSHQEWGFGDVAWERTSFADREKAREFVGTASALWGITAGVYLALMGPRGMQELGQGILQRSHYLKKELSEIPGIRILFENTPHYKEFAVNFDGTGKSVEEINKALYERDIFGGHDLSPIFPGFGQSALYCVTEKHTQEDMDRLCRALRGILKA